MIRAVLFDLDDTLFDHRECARAALVAVQQSHDRLREMPFDSLERAHAGLLEELHAEVMLGRLPLETARVERFRRLLETAGTSPDPSTAAAAAAIYRDTYRAARRGIAGAEALLAGLAAHAKIAVVSNNLLEEQRDKLRTCGLERFVDVLVVSEEAGVAKPNPEIFRIALDRLNVSAEEAVMVGDSWTADVAGARAAGIRAFWFNPLGLPAPAGADYVPELRSLDPVDTVVRMILDADRN